MGGDKRVSKKSPPLRGDLGGCLILLLLLCTVSAKAQQPQIIYSGLNNATSIYATSNHIFVIESGKNRVLKLDHDGELEAKLGGLGTGDYQFDTPIDIDATNGLKIYISDYRNNRIQIFDRRFQFLTSIKGENSFGYNRRIKPTQLVVNAFGELFFYDEASNSIHKHDENGAHRDSFELPQNFEVFDINLKGDLMELIDRKNRNVQLMSQNGVLGEQFPLVLDILEMDSVKTENWFFVLRKDSILKY